MINYEYLENGTVRTGSWQGDPAEAIKAAVEHLGAEYDDEAGTWTYEAPESGGFVLIDEDELLQAGAAILSGAGDWYSLWCARTGAPAGR